VKFGDLFRLSLENLWRTKLRSILTTLGVIIGIGVLVSMVSFGTGIQRNVTEAFLENDLFTSMQVLPTKVDIQGIMSGDIGGVAEAEDAPPLDQAALETIRAIPEVEIAYPEIIFPAKLKLGEYQTRTNIRGLPAGMGEFKPFSELPYGRFFEDDAEHSIVLSQRTLQNMGIRIDDPSQPERAGRDEDDELVDLPPDSLLGREIELVSSVLDNRGLARSFMMGLPPTTRSAFREETTTLTIIGIEALTGGFESGRFRGGAMVPIDTAEEVPRLGFSRVWDLLGRKGDREGFASVYVRVRSIDDLEPARAVVDSLGFGVLAIADELEEFRRNFLIFDSLLGAVGTIALIVASLGIVNTMVTSILERTREIGIMKAIGGSEIDIRRIFFVEAATIGVLGGVLGVLLAWVVTRIANVVANAHMRPEGFAEVDFFYLPGWLILGAIGFSIAVSLLAGVYPAMRAARVDPVKALRHD